MRHLIYVARRRLFHKELNCMHFVNLSSSCDHSLSVLSLLSHLKVDYLHLKPFMNQRNFWEVAKRELCGVRLKVALTCKLDDTYLVSILE